MKKFLCLTILFSMFYVVDDLNAQSFSFTNVGPVFLQFPYIPDSNRYVNRLAVVRNISSDTIHFRFARIVNDLPQEWYTAMGYDLSYPPFIDTISLPSDPPLWIPPGHQDTNFFIYFGCKGPGLGTAIVKMYNVDNPAEYVQDTFKIQVGSVGITPLSTVVKDYDLSQNYPNPFNPGTSINFSIPISQRVSLKIFDILGNEIENVINHQLLTTGTYKIDFNGSHMSSGIYYYTIVTENFIDTKKMILVK